MVWETNLVGLDIKCLMFPYKCVCPPYRSWAVGLVLVPPRLLQHCIPVSWPRGCKGLHQPVEGACGRLLGTPREKERAGSWCLLSNSHPHTVTSLTLHSPHQWHTVILHIPHQWHIYLTPHQSHTVTLHNPHQ